eukprot:g24662.t1
MEDNQDDPGEISIPGYKVGALLGEGNTAEVRAGVSLKTEQNVAIKLMKHQHGGWLANSEVIALRRCEAAAVVHKGVVRFFDAFQANGRSVVVLERLEGRELYDDIAEARERSDDHCLLAGLGRERALDVLGQLLLALRFLHENKIAHRDLKPANLISQPNGDIKLVDFGSAYVGPRDQEEHMVDTVCGSQHYLAPELCSDEYAPIDPFLTDIWSTGIILFVMLCGWLPFDEDGLDATRAAILQGPLLIPEEMDADLKELICMMCQYEPCKRSSLSELLAHPSLKLPLQQIRARERAENAKHKIHRRAHSMSFLSVILDHDVVQDPEETLFQPQQAPSPTRSNLFALRGVLQSSSMSELPTTSTRGFRADKHGGDRTDRTDRSDLSPTAQTDDAQPRRGKLAVHRDKDKGIDRGDLTPQLTSPGDSPRARNNQKTDESKASASTGSTAAKASPDSSLSPRSAQLESDTTWNFPLSAQKTFTVAAKTNSLSSQLSPQGTRRSTFSYSPDGQGGSFNEFSSSPHLSPLASPRREPTSPRLQQTSPRRDSTSPRREPTSPRREPVSPRHWVPRLSASYPEILPLIVEGSPTEASNKEETPTARTPPGTSLQLANLSPRHRRGERERDKPAERERDKPHLLDFTSTSPRNKDKQVSPTTNLPVPSQGALLLSLLNNNKPALSASAPRLNLSQIPSSDASHFPFPSPSRTKHLIGFLDLAGRTVDTPAQPAADQTRPALPPLPTSTSTWEQQQQSHGSFQHGSFSHKHAAAAAAAAGPSIILHTRGKISPSTLTNSQSKISPKTANPAFFPLPQLNTNSSSSSSSSSSAGPGTDVASNPANVVVAANVGSILLTARKQLRRSQGFNNASLKLQMPSPPSAKVLSPTPMERAAAARGKMLHAHGEGPPSPKQPRQQLSRAFSVDKIKATCSESACSDQTGYSSEEGVGAHHVDEENEEEEEEAEKSVDDDLRRSESMGTLPTLATLKARLRRTSSTGNLRETQGMPGHWARRGRPSSTGNLLDGVDGFSKSSPKKTSVQNRRGSISQLRASRLSGLSSLLQRHPPSNVGRAGAGRPPLTRTTSSDLDLNPFNSSAGAAGATGSPAGLHRPDRSPLPREFTRIVHGV